MAVDLSVDSGRMRNLALSGLFAVVVAGCGGRSVGGGGSSASGDGAAGQPGRPAPVVHLALELTAIPDSNPIRFQVELVTTDQTGSSQRNYIGEFAGICRDTSAAHTKDAMTPILSADCTGGDPAMLLRFVLRGSQVIVLRAPVVPGEEPSFDEQARVDLPSGVPVKTDTL